MGRDIISKISNIEYMGVVIRDKKEKKSTRNEIEYLVGKESNFIFIF